MLVSAAVLMLAGGSPMATDLVPSSLAARPTTVNLGDMTYDWGRQQSRAASGQRVADNTANCSTCCIETQSNGKTDQVHDCGFD